MIDGNICMDFEWDFDLEKAPLEDLWLFKWEATNIYSYIFETDDLSCIRGASQLLEDFKKEIEIILDREIKKGCITIWPIYYAASNFLALVKGKRERIEAFGMRIVKRFNGRDYFGTSGFGIINLYALWSRGHKKLIDAIHQCEEQIVRQRLSTLDIYPGESKKPNESESVLDEIDCLRLADTDSLEVFRDGLLRTYNVSKGTCVKFEKGVSDRWGLIKQICNEGLNLKLVTSELKRRSAEESKKPLYQDLSSLAKMAEKNKGYIAFISADGNKFTEIREELKTLRELSEFSHFIKTVIKGSIATALDKELKKIESGLEKTKDNREDSDTTQPAHLLFMAGDEFDLIVTGERGCEVVNILMETFSQKCKSELSKYNTIKNQEKLKELSISIGLVFTHANTPINLIRQAAHELKDMAKGKGHDSFAVDFMTFESHPTTSDTIAEYRKDILEISGNKFHNRPYLKEDFDKLITMIKKAKDTGFPRTQLHKIVSMIMNLRKSGDNELQVYLTKIEEKIKGLEFKEGGDDIKGFLVSNSFKGVIDFFELYDYAHI